jgi:SAM-dependent methyltransferase
VFWLTEYSKPRSADRKASQAERRRARAHPHTWDCLRSTPELAHSVWRGPLAAPLEVGQVSPVVFENTGRVEASAKVTADSVWTAGVEELGACPVCHSSARTLLYAGLRDIVFHVAPGAWNMFRCDACACRYLDPRPTRESILLAYQGYFTHQAPAPDSLLAPGTLPRRRRNDFLAARFGYDLPHREPFGRYAVHVLPPRRRRYERLVRDLPAPRPGGRLLDVGCGNGEFLVRMRELGWTVAGHDFDPEAARVVRGLGIEVAEGPLGADSFTQPFDAITLHHVIEHVHDPVEFLQACRQLLAPGGAIWIATPNAESLGWLRFGRYWMPLDCPRHLCVFSRRGLDVALDRAGFVQRSVNADIGQYGATATAVEVARRTKGGKKLHPLEARIQNVVGDALMLLRPSLGEELVATAKI